MALPTINLRLGEIVSVLYSPRPPLVPYSVAQVCTHPNVNKFGLHPSYVAGADADARLANLQSTPYNMSHFRGYDHFAFGVPSTPTGLFVVEAAPGLAIEAHWNSVSEASSYLVQHRVNSGLITQVEVYSESWYNYPPYNVGDYVEVRVAAKNLYGTSAFTGWAGTLVFDILPE